VMDAWPESRGEALHTSTFLGHPLACAAALAFLDVLEEEDLVERAGRLGTLLLDRLRSALAGAEGVREVRGRGLFVGIETDHPPGGGGGVRATGAVLGRGLIVLPAGDLGEVLELSPPLVITQEQLTCGIEILVDQLSGGSRRSIRPDRV
jgi:4-aminobutyrate aminotransferase-like enzyme